VESLLTPLLRHSRVVRKLPTTQEIRSGVLEELEYLAL
jgi:hypothetical protein